MDGHIHTQDTEVDRCLEPDFLAHSEGMVTRGSSELGAAVQASLFVGSALQYESGAHGSPPLRIVAPYSLLVTIP